MNYALITLTIFAALFHIVAFALESLFFKKGAHKRFFVTEDQVEAVYPFAFNQGFYNLFLALALLAGLMIKLDGHILGVGMMATSAGVMMGAGAVLAYSNKDLLMVAILQGLPPAIIIFLLL